MISIWIRVSVFHSEVFSKHAVFSADLFFLYLLPPIALEGEDGKIFKLGCYNER